MIKTVSVTNHINQTLELVLEDPEKSGFLVTDITGLGPPKANVNMTPNGSIDGSIFNSAILPERNIVISLRFIGEDVEGLRQKTYKYFPIKRMIRFTIETTSRKCEIYGVVESNEPTIFSDQCGSQISIICPDPYFVDCGNNAEKLTIFYGVEPLFGFPFGNNSTTEKLLSFGKIDNQAEKLIIYDGDSEVGITIKIKALGPAKNVALYNSMNKTLIRIDTDKLQTITGGPLTTGDEITITTTIENRSVTLLRNGIYTNVLNCLGKFPKWLVLVPGDNVLMCVSDEGFSNLIVTMSYKTIYEGV